MWNIGDSTLSLKKQSLFHSAGSLTLMGFQWLISVLLVRIDGYEDAGIFSLAMSLSNVFSMFANYGIRNLILTDYQNKYSTIHYLVARLVTSVTALIACLFYVSFFATYNLTERLCVVFYLIYSLTTIACDTLMAYVQLNNHLEINGISNIIRGSLSFIAFTAVIVVTHSLLYSTATMATISLCVFLFFDVRHYYLICGIPQKTTQKELKKSIGILREGFPIMLSLLIPVMMTAIPRIAIKTILSSELLGYFSSIYTPAVVLSTVIPPVLVAGVPAISKAWNERQWHMLRSKLAQNYVIVAGAMCIAFIAALLIGRMVLCFVFGKSILQYYQLIYFAILTIGLNCFCVCGNNIIVAIGNKNVMMFMTVTALIITWSGSWKMVLKNGLYGAAFISIIAYGFQFTMQLCYIIWHVCKTMDNSINDKREGN